MRKPGWDARRRNRNIGTAKSGHGEDNRLTIPMSWADNRLFHEKLENPIVLSRTINGNGLIFLVEPTRPGNAHASTPQDIVRELELIPSEHLRDIKLIVLRQPKKKERILSPVWGRLLYWAEIRQYTGPAVHLEAQDVRSTFKWETSLTPDQEKELERLREDGHRVIQNRRHYEISTSLDSIRNTQLFRTLPHEIGHYVDYLESVSMPAGDSENERGRLDKLYWTKPRKDKEDFDHRYATEFYERNKALFPFPRQLDRDVLATEDLDLAWFEPSQ